MYRISTLLAVPFAALAIMALPSSTSAQSSSRSDQNYDNAQNQQPNSRYTGQNQEQEQYRSRESINGPGSGSISGVVQSYGQVNVNGESHFRVRLRTPEGRVQSVDLGPSTANQQLIDSIEEGDHVSFQGSEQDLSGKNVFLASRARVEGQSYSVSQSGEFGQGQLDRSQSRQNGRQSASQGQQSRPMVLLEEQRVFVTPSDLGRHLLMARQAIESGDTASAAAELRVAADRVGLYAAASRTLGGPSQDLASAKQNLKQLADQISRSNGNIQPDQLDDAAARAQLAMAKFYDQQFQGKQQQGQAIEAGYDLQAAAIHARRRCARSVRRSIPPTT